MIGQVLVRAREDMLKSERELRALTEEHNRELRAVLRDLAYRLAGQEMETIRRADPLAPDHWTPERWTEFFRASPKLSAGNWNNSTSASGGLQLARVENPRIVEESRNIQCSLEASQDETGRERRGCTRPHAAPKGDAIVKFPEMPRQPPIPHAVRLDTGTRWRRGAMALYLMAVLGWSTRKEILETIAKVERIGGDSGSLRRVFTTGLVPAGYVSATVLAMNLSHGPTRLTAVRLSERGQDLARALGWEPVESDWARVLRLHQGEVQGAHTAAVLSFVFNARRRGWQTQVVPEVQGASRPDVLVERGGERAFVEVELGSEKPGKWRNQSALQGFVALCAASEPRRAQLVAECKVERLAGRATDIETLIQTSGGVANGGLWVEEWQAAR